MSSDAEQKQVTVFISSISANKEVSHISSDENLKFIHGHVDYVSITKYRVYRCW